MRRVSLILAIVVIAALTAAAQTPTSSEVSGGSTTAPAGTAPAANPAPATNQMPAPPTGAVVTPASPTGPTTPSITLGTASSSGAGATSATPGNQAGATNSTLQPTPSTTPVVENTPGAGVLNTANANDQQAGSRDLLIGSSDSAWSVSMETVGVAAAARQARALRANHKPRVFTNADIARLRDRGAVSVVGNTAAPVTSEQTMPASDVDAERGPTTPAVPQQDVQAPAEQNPPAQQPKSPFRSKPSPRTEPR